MKAYTKQQKHSRKQMQRLHDRILFENTLMAQREPMDDLNISETIALPSVDLENNGELFKPRKCYICKAHFKQLHPLYHSHCPTCAARDFKKRTNATDLTGYRALLTGARIKIGYEIALKLLRDGAEVIATTRFPKDALKRYQQEPDFDEWSDRLTIYYLDLKQIPAVEAFTRHLCETLPSLEIIINNAAQTIRRPKAYYAHLNKGEQRPLSQQELQMLGEWYPNNGGYQLLEHKLPTPNPLPRGELLEHSEDTEPVEVPGQLETVSHPLFPAGKLDKHGEQVDLRERNTWNMTLSNFDIMEMLEVQMVNVTAPMILNSRLKPLMLRSPHAKRFIINVSAMEGQFNRKTKTQFHPHTNMAKAALNMMTRTSAQEYARDHIYMNSVDTGWVTQEHPYHIKKKLRLKGFIPPLDIIDGAARVYDPIVEGMAMNQPEFGHFYKDYVIAEW